MAKKKRTTSVDLVRGQFRRRIWRDIHIGTFLAAQAAIWLWWIAEHLRSGAGFHANFFWDRAIVLVVWGVILVTHIWVTRLMNVRDRQINALLENQFDDENVVVQPKFVNMRRLEESYSDQALDDSVDEEPTRNHNHR